MRCRALCGAVAAGEAGGFLAASAEGPVDGLCAACTSNAASATIRAYTHVVNALECPRKRAMAAVLGLWCFASPSVKLGRVVVRPP